MTMTKGRMSHKPIPIQCLWQKVVRAIHPIPISCLWQKVVRAIHPIPISCLWQKVVRAIHQSHAIYDKRSYVPATLYVYCMPMAKGHTANQSLLCRFQHLWQKSLVFVLLCIASSHAGCAIQLTLTKGHVYLLCSPRSLPIWCASLIPGAKGPE